MSRFRSGLCHLNGHPLKVALDGQTFRLIVAHLKRERRAEDTLRALIRADAPLSMMRALFGMGGKDYAGWPALKKIEFIDKMMRSIRGKAPYKKSGPKWRQLRSIRMTIAYSHKLKRKAMEEDFPDYFDRDLYALFSAEAPPKSEKAGRFLRRHRRSLVRSISQWTMEKRYTVHALVTRLAERADELKLRVQRSELETLSQASVCLTAMAKNYFLTGKFKRPV